MLALIFLNCDIYDLKKSLCYDIYEFNVRIPSRCLSGFDVVSSVSRTSCHLCKFLKNAAILKFKPWERYAFAELFIYQISFI